MSPASVRSRRSSDQPGPRYGFPERGPASTSRMSRRRSGGQISCCTFHALASRTSSVNRQHIDTVQVRLRKPNVRVVHAEDACRGAAGSRRNMSASGDPPASPRISRIVDGRSTCDVGASETVIGPARFGGLIIITAFAVEAIPGSRTVEGPGMRERLSLRPAETKGLQIRPVIGRHDNEAAVVDAERTRAVEHRRNELYRAA